MTKYGQGGQTKDNMIHILAIMSESGLINAQTYDAIIGFYIENENLDMALHKLAEMNDLDMTPGLETAQRLIVLAVQTGYPRLALDLALAYENTSVRRIDTETWMKLLTASAQNLYVSFSSSFICMSHVSAHTRVCSCRVMEFNIAGIRSPKT